MNRRKVVYGFIYIGIAIAFPALPLEGLKFIGGVFRGSIEGSVKEGTDMVKGQVKTHVVEQFSDWKHELFKSLNPFD